MARLAQSQANYCARVGHLVHSNKFAFQGGENLAEGGGNFSPRAIVNCWLRSKAGHREYLLSSRVRKAGVGIAKSKGKTYVAWAFSDQPPSYPDCPYYKRPSKRRRLKRPCKSRTPISLFLGFVGALGMVFGAHGLYVYFSGLEGMYGGEFQKLFLHIDMPIRLQGAVQWMSIKGAQSWFIPAAVLAGGIVLWKLRRKM